MNIATLLGALEPIEDKSVPAVLRYMAEDGSYMDRRFQEIGSWRGVYEQASIYPGQFVYEFKTDQTVADLFSFLEDSIGDTMTGWKGGEFLVRADLPLWADDAGDCGQWQPTMVGQVPDLGVFVACFKIDYAW